MSVVKANANNSKLGLGRPGGPINMIPIRPTRSMTNPNPSEDFNFPLDSAKKSLNYPSEADTDEEIGSMEEAGEGDDCDDKEDDDDLDSDDPDPLHPRGTSSSSRLNDDSDSSNFEDLVSTEFFPTRPRKSSKPAIDAIMYNPAQLLQKNGLITRLRPKRIDAIGPMTASETKRQDYHVFLKKSGLLGAISKVFLALHECTELPTEENAAEFIANTLGFTMNKRKEVEELKAYNETLKARIQRLDATNDLLRRSLDMYECTEAEVEHMDPDPFHPNLNPDFPPPKLQLKRRKHRSKPVFNFKFNLMLHPKSTKAILQDAISKMDAFEKSRACQNQRFSYPHVWRDNELCELYHGVKITDPYRWLEDENSDRVREFVCDQNEITMDYLEACPKRNLIRKRLTELLNYERFSSPFKAGKKYYYFKNSGLQNQSVMYVQNSLHGEPKVFFDPNPLSKDGTVAIADYKFSEDGKIFAYSLSKSGSDWVTIYFQNAHTHENYRDALERVKFSNISWTHDNRGILYACYPRQQGKGDGTEKMRNLNQQIYYHRIGTSQDNDVLVIAFPENPTWHLVAQITDCGRYVIVNASEEISKEGLFYARIEDDVETGISQMFTLEPIVSQFNAKYTYITNEDEIFYFVTNLNAPNNRVVAVDIRCSEDESQWRSVIPEHPNDALEWAKCVDGNKLVVCYIKDVKNALTIFHLRDGSMLQQLPLEVGTVTEFTGSKKDHEIFFQFSSFLTRGRIYYVDLSNPEFELSLFHDADMEGMDNHNYEVSQIFYPGMDGARVHMFIIHKKNLELTGEHLCLLYGYGGFGVSVTPGFYSIFTVILQNMQGVIAVANIRGGGEFGENWHQAGVLENKQTCFNDFQAAAEYLIRMKYTKASKLIIKGRSNGGLLVGACINQRPDLFGAAIAQVGVMDLLRFDKFTIGHAWCSDYGKPSNKSDFHNLLKLSPLHNVTAPPPDVQFPAVLLTTADHDDRVVPLHSYKFIAELQHRVGRLSCQTNPLLLRVETNTGHGFHTPISKWIEEETDILSFVIQAMGAKFTYTV